MKKGCAIEGCANKLLAKGLCSTHYGRLRKYGTTDAAPKERPTRRLDLTGRVFCMLNVTSMEFDDGQSIAVCICKCGKQRRALAYRLTNGDVRSCGCTSYKDFLTEEEREEILARKKKNAIAIGRKNKTHGQSKTKTYASWSDAKKRCFSKKNKRYPEYGGRGISMHQEWVNSFDAFHRDMGDCPTGTTLDRINVDGHYEPGNCRWATRLEQARNTRANVIDAAGVKALRAAHAAGVDYAELQKTFKMSRGNIYQIVSRQTWKDV